MIYLKIIVLGIIAAGLLVFSIHLLTQGTMNGIIVLVYAGIFVFLIKRLS